MTDSHSWVVWLSLWSIYLSLKQSVTQVCEWMYKLSRLLTQLSWSVSRSPRNPKWTDGGGRFQECHVRGGDGSTIFHTGDEAISTERERIIPKGSNPSKVKIGKEGRKKRKRDKMGSYKQEMQFDKDQTSGAGLSSQQTFMHISLLLIDTLQIHQKFGLTWNIRGILELHDATIYLSTMHDSCNGYGT